MDPQVKNLIDTALNKAVRVPGPVKLYHGKTDRTGLFAKKVGAFGKAVQHGFNAMPALWAEELRTPLNQPIYVRLLPGGLEWLIRNTNPKDRPGLVAGASAIYQLPLLQRWSLMARTELWDEDHAKIARCCNLLINQIVTIAESKDMSPAPSPPPPPQVEVVEEDLSREDSDFKRRLAQELVVAWKHSPNAEAKQAVAAAMSNAGLTPIGTAGDRVIMDGTIHLCREPVFPGDPVEVVEPGWSVNDGFGEFLLEKAIVKID